ncbi:MAG TPA: hypothetical protein DD669_04780 [Pseudomonas sp.]|nr:hypothetical protein [Pseudomonas sp. TMW22080]HBP47137.1 hypothetical protein [Pseudomonas sp.]
MGSVKFVRNLWERACSRWHHSGESDAPRSLYREQARSHTISWVFFSADPPPPRSIPAPPTAPVPGCSC